MSIESSKTKTATWRRYVKDALPLSVSDFGAIGGNTLVDESTEIQAALDALSDGEALYFPNPPYSAENLQLKGRITLIGDGDRFTDTIKGLGTNPVFITGTYPAGNTALNRDITLDGMTINGNGDKALEWHTAVNFHWYRCYFYTTGIAAVEARFSFRGIMDDCRFSTTGAFTALDIYDNCNAITLIAPVATGGSSGKAITIDKCASVDIIKPIVESSKSGIEIASHATNTGNCQAVNISGGYMEDIETPFILGADGAITGGSLIGVYFGQGTPTTNPYFIRLGAVNNFVVKGLSGSANATAAPKVIDFYDVDDAGTVLFPTGCEITIPEVTNATSIDLSNLSNASFAADIFAKNKIFVAAQNDSDDPDLDAYRTHGELREYISESITCNVAVAIYDFIPSTENVFIEKVEIFGALGTLDGTLEIGTSTSITEILNFDMSTASVTRGYQDLSSSLSKQRSRDGSSIRLRMTAGSQTGTYRARISYRGKTV